MTGFADSYAAKLAAERIVKRVRGVRALANDVQVRLRGEKTDPQVAKDALHALRHHTSVPAGITVTVRDGFVTLDGTVEWMYQKAAAESAVKYLKGVTGVANLIRISPTAPAAEAKKRIEEALGRSADVHARNVRVEVQDDTVTLSGAVQTWAEAREAERAAWAAPGIADVKNDLVISS